MSCEKFDERLQQLLDQRLEPADDRELQHHARQCDDCRSLLEAQRQLFSAFEFDGGAELSEDFAEKITAAFVAERPPQKRWWQNAWTGAFIAVSALLLLALLPGLRRSSPVVPPKPDAASVVKSGFSTVPVVAVTKEVPRQTPSAPEPLDTNIVAPVDMQKRAIAGAKGEPLAVASVQTPAAGTGDWIDNLRESISEVSLENLEPMDQIADGFRPVATSLQSAVGVLRRTLPGGGEQRQKPMPDASGMWSLEQIAHA